MGNLLDFVPSISIIIFMLRVASSWHYGLQHCVLYPYLTLPRGVSIDVACHGPPSFPVLRHSLALLEVQAGPL